MSSEISQEIEARLAAEAKGEAFTVGRLGSALHRRTRGADQGRATYRRPAALASRRRRRASPARHLRRCSVEPGIVDTNVLIYALDADAAQHAAARALLDAARADASATLYVTTRSVCEFYSVVTNPRRVPRPRTAAEAVDAVSGLLAYLRVLPVPARTVDGWLELLRRHPVTGGDVFDLQIAATMQANGIRRSIRSTPPTSRSFRNSRSWSPRTASLGCDLSFPD